MNASSTSAKAAGPRSISTMVYWISPRVMANHSFLVVDAGHSARPSRTEPSRPKPSRMFGISHLMHDHPAEKAAQMQFFPAFLNVQEEMH